MAEPIDRLVPMDRVKFNQDGLAPAIIQDAETGRVLMLGYMNRESLARTVESGLTWFYSRSRRKLWQKGETSGHVQKVRAIEIDCDQDTLLIQVEQVGPGACHEGFVSCFHYQLEGAASGEAPAQRERPTFDPDQVYRKRS